MYIFREAALTRGEKAGGRMNKSIFQKKEENHNAKRKKALLVEVTWGFSEKEERPKNTETYRLRPSKEPSRKRKG